MQQLEEDDDEREDMGDIDLWCLSPDGLRLVVNPRWMHHLQGRLLGDDGHPRKAKVWRTRAGSPGFFFLNEIFLCLIPILF